MGWFSFFRRRGSEAAATGLTIEGETFAVGGTITGVARFPSGAAARSAEVGLRLVEMVNGVAVSNPMRSSQALRMAGGAQRFALAVPASALEPIAHGHDEQVEQSFWAVVLELDRVNRASRNVVLTAAPSSGAPDDAGRR